MTARGTTDSGAMLVLTVGVLCVSTGAVLIRLADAPPLVVAAYRLTFASAIVVPLALVRSRDELLGLTRHDTGRIIVSGLFLAVHFALWITSLEYTSVASSVVLVSTNPLWVALAAPLVLGESVPRRLYAGIALAFIGCAVIARGDMASGQEAVFGDLLALGGALAAAAYFLIGRDVRRRVSLLPYVALVYGTAAVSLLVTAVATGQAMTGYSRDTWLYMLLLALVPQILGHSSFNWALSRLSAPFVAGTVLGESAGSTLLAWWILSEAPPPTALTGGALILVGLFVAARAETTVDARDTPVERVSPGPL